MAANLTATVPQLVVTVGSSSQSDPAGGGVKYSAIFERWFRWEPSFPGEMPQGYVAQVSGQTFRSALDVKLTPDTGGPPGGSAAANGEASVGVGFAGNVDTWLTLGGSVYTPQLRHLNTDNPVLTPSKPINVPGGPPGQPIIVKVAGLFRGRAANSGNVYQVGTTATAEAVTFTAGSNWIQITHP